MKINTVTIRNITRAMNAAGWRGNFKELSNRVDLDTGRVSVNLLAMGEEHDLNDKWNMAEWTGTDLDLVNGLAHLEVWAYDNHDCLRDVVSVYLVDVGRAQPAVMMHEPDQADILRAAVAAAAR
jgi:hypothetical protein